jgi:hypothetical protein
MTICYDLLLSRMGSFDGNRVKVVGATDGIVFERLHNFYAELLFLHHGVERDVKMWLESCVTLTSAMEGLYG